VRGPFAQAAWGGGLTKSKKQLPGGAVSPPLPPIGATLAAFIFSTGGAVLLGRRGCGLVWRCRRTRSARGASKLVATSSCLRYAGQECANKPHMYSTRVAVAVAVATFLAKGYQRRHKRAGEPKRSQRNEASARPSTTTSRASQFGLLPIATDSLTVPYVYMYTCTIATCGLGTPCSSVGSPATVLSRSVSSSVSTLQQDESVAETKRPFRTGVRTCGWPSAAGCWRPS
jgi:hypothetical protein